MDVVRISVAVASYNGEAYIREQLDSILRNLTAQDEVVVSDDGSSDGTVPIIKEYQGGKIPVRLYEGPGRGIKQNIGAALSHCAGRYIFLADQDDVWMENKVSRVMERLGRDGCKLVCHNARVMDTSLAEEKMPSFFAYRGSKPGFFPNLWKNRYMGCCMAFDRELLPLVLPIPEEIEMHDQWIGMINDARGKNGVFLQDALILYRRHSANVSDFSHGTAWQMLRKRAVFLKAFLLRRAELKRKGLWRNPASLP